MVETMKEVAVDMPDVGDMKNDAIAQVILDFGLSECTC